VPVLDSRAATRVYLRANRSGQQVYPKLVCAAGRGIRQVQVGSFVRHVPILPTSAIMSTGKHTKFKDFSKIVIFRR